ncbi:DUF1360 domain-containing protein [Ammoniphilus sp. YIM 78166]|uniref:DUF1360 domain-containing protein n=1 Tax=Ammoniphilus sp. YIM 78166 TaxID=1644106 RepID=UPI00106F6E9E|nr:DUF1360 domain-containing protein [Ammoniphilus sp. YIM 78166]
MVELVNITWLHLAILILASFRLTHLVVYDEITSFLRAPFMSESYEMDDNGEMIRKVEIKGSGLRYWIGSLLSCHWCVGIWSSLALVLLYWFLPLTFVAIIILSVSGGAAILSSRV